MKKKKRKKQHISKVSLLPLPTTESMKRNGVFIHLLDQLAGRFWDAYFQNVACRSWDLASGLCRQSMKILEPAEQLSFGRWHCGPAVFSAWQLFQPPWPATAASADRAPSRQRIETSTTRREICDFGSQHQRKCELLPWNKWTFTQKRIRCG